MAVCLMGMLPVAGTVHAEESTILDPGYNMVDAVAAFEWDGPVLCKGLGVVYGPSGKETYYNLPMDGVVRIMRGMGFDEEKFPYWEREDGCKMLGDFIMVAANLDVHPRGSLVPCSLGVAIVCDTGGFAYNDPQQLDIAVNW